MDNNAKLWDVETGQEIGSLQGHTAEIVSLHFNTEGDKILTGSFDTTAKVGRIEIDLGYSYWSLHLDSERAHRRAELHSV